MRRRYVYTPRRHQSVSRAGRPAWRSIVAPAVAVAAVLGLGLSLWLAIGGGSSGDATTCDGGPCATTAAATPGAASSSVGVVGPIGHDPAPTITGYAAAVVEEPCGAVLHRLNEHLRLPPASLAKIATALVTADRADPAQAVEVTVDGGELSVATDATIMGLKPGQQLSIRDLLFGLLLPSGNDAAIELAQQVSRGVAAFVDLMNEKVQQLGLTDTHFTNPHGLDDPGTYTSAYDMAMLGRELLHQPGLADIVQTRAYKPAWDGPELRNLNRLLDVYEGSIGIKTGYTDQAGQTIVAAADRGGRRLIVTVLKSTDLYQDAVRLLEWAFRNTQPACSPASQAQTLP